MVSVSNDYITTSAFAPTDLEEAWYPVAVRAVSFCTIPLLGDRTGCPTSILALFRGRIHIQRLCMELGFEEACPVSEL